ncbi:PREDICTED: GAS2-like protein 1 [Vollenhovia emeryi]|uniref:GAS2-like protein 1 n=1 Tax=Vollenhovia emeryi TaxID=411798 RepID=UPI0005F5304C|nr:PREDICTED: GAS2-like protein 1 [Vollenhovia emeryi]
MSVLLEGRSYRPFKSSEEYLVAMKEDLAEWLNALYPELRINLDNFMDRLDTGVALCKHANNVRKYATDYVARRQARKMPMTRSITSLALPMSQVGDVPYLPNAKAGTFFARDNVSNFIDWCRNSLGIIECLLFETEDLIMRKNERHVILCLLEVARRGAKFGMLAPLLVQMERQIDREIAAENKAANGAGNEESDDEYEEEPCLIYGPQPQIVTNDLKTLHELVRDIVEECTCPTQFPMIHVAEGKYRIGDTKVTIYVRVLRSHVMVRVGGGWDTLSHYLEKHDPCRCRNSHRSMVSAKLIQKAGGSFDLGNAQVHYERSSPPRTRRSSASSVGSVQNLQSAQLHAPPRSISSNRSRSPTPHRPTAGSKQQQHQQQSCDEPKKRSRSPTPHRKLLPSPNHQADLAKQRSRSPTPRANLRSRSPTPRKNADSSRRNANEEARSPTYHGKPQENGRECGLKVPGEFTKRYVVEGGVARRAVERDDTPKYEPSIYNYKCSEDSSGSRSPTPSKEEQPALETFGKDTAANTQKSPHGDGEHSDNCSEVSDEGYRSLGAVQSSTANGNSASTQGSPTVADCQKQPPKAEPEERSGVETDSIETGLRKVVRKDRLVSPLRVSSPSRSATSSSTGDRTPRAGSIARENSNLSKASSGSKTPKDSNSSPEGSPLNRGGSIRNKTNGSYGTLRKLTPTGSLSKVSSPMTAPKSSKAPVGSSATWNGRQTRRRASIQTDTFLDPRSMPATCATTPSFSRKSPGRQSLQSRPNPNFGVQYDKNGRRIRTSATGTTSLQSSPTKVTNPLLDQILQKLGDLKDERQMVQKLQGLLRDYQTSSTDGVADMEFAKVWVDSNGAMTVPQDVQVSVSPRKDPKPQEGCSRIPVPRALSYKRPMSVASDSV